MSTYSRYVVSGGQATLSANGGTNGSVGSAALVAGTVVVPTTAITSSSIIFLTINAGGGTIGVPYVSARSAGVSFTISSSTGALDTSLIGWLLVVPN